jgi:hypothetical protein
VARDEAKITQSPPASLDTMMGHTPKFAQQASQWPDFWLIIAFLKWIF